MVLNVRPAVLLDPLRIDDCSQPGLPGTNVGASPPPSEGSLRRAPERQGARRSPRARAGSVPRPPEIEPAPLSPRTRVSSARRPEIESAPSSPLVGRTSTRRAPGVEASPSPAGAGSRSPRLALEIESAAPLRGAGGGQPPRSPVDVALFEAELDAMSSADEDDDDLEFSQLLVVRAIVQRPTPNDLSDATRDMLVRSALTAIDLPPGRAATTFDLLQSKVVVASPLQATVARHILLRTAMQQAEGIRERPSPLFPGIPRKRHPAQRRHVAHPASFAARWGAALRDLRRRPPRARPRPAPPPPFETRTLEPGARMNTAVMQIELALFAGRPTPR